jgi:hypothetical protein
MAFVGLNYSNVNIKLLMYVEKLRYIVYLVISEVTFI